MGSVLFPLLEVCPSISDRGVGDRVRSFQEFGNFSIDSLLGWRLLLPQVLVQDQGDWAEDPDEWIPQVDFDGDQLRLTLSIEWRSGSAQELDPLLPEAWCDPTPDALIQALKRLRQKWNSAQWSQLRQSYGLIPESVVLMIQAVPKFQATGQVVRWIRSSPLCSVLETDGCEGHWRDGQELTIGQKAELCQAVLAMPDLWHEDYTLTWGLDGDQQFWILAVAVGETLLALPTVLKSSVSLSRDSADGTFASGMARLLPTTFPDGFEMPLSSTTIAVVKTLLPEAVPFLRSVQAIIVEAPGLNNHGVILARELGIPVVVGIENATQTITDGEALVLRGLASRGGAVAPRCEVPLKRKTALLVNRTQVAFCNEWTEGVGLVRSEWLILPEFPLERLRANVDTELFKRLIRSRLTVLVEALIHRDDVPVLYYRCLGDGDVPGAALELSAWHDLQQVAWVQGRSLPPIRMVLPFVQTLAQFVRWRQDLAALNLDTTVQPWIMVEVPSVAMMLGDYIEAGAKGLVIGLNDLTQWTLGTTRMSELFQNSMEIPDGAVVRSVQQILSTAQRFNIPCWLALSSWSEAWAEVAIEAGVTGLMVERDTVMAAAQTIDRIEACDSRFQTRWPVSPS